MSDTTAWRQSARTFRLASIRVVLGRNAFVFERGTTKSAAKIEIVKDRGKTTEYPAMKCSWKKWIKEPQTRGTTNYRLAPNTQPQNFRRPCPVERSNVRAIDVSLGSGRITPTANSATCATCLDHRPAPNRLVASPVSRPPLIPSGSWPMEMRAQKAAAYCDEPSVAAFLAKVDRGIYSAPARQKGCMPKWHRRKLDQDIARRHGLPLDLPIIPENVTELI
jgi:hypothetical protein